MTTALGIITSAMRKIGALTKGDSPSADEAVDGLEMLNDLLASISNDSMVVYSRTLENFAVSGGIQTYTIGPSATFNTVRPVKLISAYIRSANVDYELKITSDESYASLPNKTTSGGIPEYINYTNGFPQATINLYPKPASAYDLFLLTEKQLTTFSLNDTVSLPPGWRRMLVNNLAVEMAAEYGQPLPAEVAMIAKESKAEIRASVMYAKQMQWDSGLSYGNNVYSGWNN